jgi:hypothetical protein
MGYRRSNRRRRSSSRRQRRSSWVGHVEPGLVEMLLELLAVAVVALFRALMRLWRVMRGDERVAESFMRHAPPPLPMSSSPTSASGRARSTVPARAGDKAKDEARDAVSPPLPYRKVDRLMSQGEVALWHPLYLAVKGKYRLFCKVRLADVVRCPPTRPDAKRWFYKMGRFHVDFVVCEPQSTAPLLVIELDDRSHRRRASQQYDAFKDAILRSAGLPIYRIPAQQAYDPLELAQAIERLIHPPPPASRPAPPAR